MSLFNHALPIAAALSSAAVATYAVRGYALRRLLDQPNARSSHRAPTPRGGGLGIVVAFTLALVWAYFQGGAPFPWLMALLGALPVAAIGFWDDHGHVPARWRLLAHGAAAAWTLYWLGGLSTLNLGGEACRLGWLGVPLGLLFIVWMLNLYNFMDGIDGIAGVEVVTACLSAAWLAAPGTGSVQAGPLTALLLAAASAGFLVWNWPPAKIFMGDVGSGFVGFLLGVLALYMAQTGALSLVAWLILLGVFCVDATLTLLRRMASGQRWHEAHRSHAYQHAAQKFGSHRPVTLAVLAINLLWLLPLAYAAQRWPNLEAPLLAAAYLPLAGLAFRLGAGKA
jgi:Fuc2NAc and GlcNAc transferase